ncbi:ATP-binding protein [Marispirochaeta aestuarii]|uniref:ATP-binding protein n=1 Tax=Marispirochaeta aestuarii TaxID=1963862 RepID=UPI0029C6AC66|nr:ATP-binding protein [Marispirochaeta aestuarii]
MAVISLSSSACRGVAASYHNSRLLSTANAPVKTLDRLPRDGYFACMYRVYPFSALVGQEDLKTALLLCAVDPGIGGLLIQGDKGTAKTTAVRGLAALLKEYRPLPREESLVLEGDMPGSVPLRGSILTELPLNATEDRITGSIHLESILKEGTRRFEPGLLAQAHGGILYVDEVNLLESHLVDILLDAAATGINRVEREGISITHPSQFILVGTMNPEEGDLRPQFLDRFGFTIFISGLHDLEERKEIVSRRLDFDADPEGFCVRWLEDDALTAEMLRKARETLTDIEVPESSRHLIAELCSRAGVMGHRADITLTRGARALAALVEAPAVTGNHIKAMARFVLPHRIPHSGVEGFKDLADRTEQLIGGAGGGGSAQVETGSFVPGDDGSLDDPYDNTEIPGGAAAGSLVFDHFKKKRRTSPGIPQGSPK